MNRNEECEIVVNWQDNLNVHVENVRVSKLERTTQRIEVPILIELAELSKFMEDA